MASNIALVPKCTTGLKGMYCLLQFVAHPLWQGFCTDLCRPLALCWEFEVARYSGTDEGFHQHRPPWGVFPLFARLHRSNPHYYPPKWSQASKFLIPKGIYFIPSESSESVKGLKRPSSGIPFFPVPLNLSMGSESHFHPIHAIPSFAPRALLLCHGLHRIFSN